MNRPANIYSAIVFDLHPKVKEYIDQLNNDGQVDLDDDGYPYLVKVDRNGANQVCHLVRNGKMENFIMNTRRSAEPINSWKPEDGFRRMFGKKVIAIDVNPAGDDGRRAERAKRTSIESIKRLVNHILDD